MKTKRFLWAGLLLLMSFSPSVVSAKSSPSKIDGLKNVAKSEKGICCTPELRTWLNKYGRHSPMNARNIVTEWPVTKAEVLSILSGEVMIRFPKELEVEGNRYTELNINEFGRMLKADKQGDRVVRTLREAIAQRQPGELLVLLTSESHAYDLFFSLLENGSINPSIYFSAFPQYYGTPYHTPETYQYYAQIGNREFPEHRYVGEMSLIVHTLFLAKLYSWAQKVELQLSYDVITREYKSVSPSVIVFMDHYQIGVSNPIDSLPSAAELKVAGISMIRVLIEGLPAGPLTDSDFAENYDIGKFMLAHLPGQLRSLLETHEQAFNLLMSGNVLFHPTQKALHSKMKSYSRDLLPVSYSGFGSW